MKYEGETRRVLVEKTSAKEWSENQTNFYHKVGSTDQSILVEAVAGSGKTTTAVEGLKYATRYNSIAFVAFNRSIAQDFKEKVPAGVMASTYHSLGLRSIKASMPDVKVDGDNVKDFNYFKQVTENMPDGTKLMVGDYRSEALRLVSLVKNTLAEPSIASMQLLSDTYGIDIGKEDESDIVLDTALKVFNLSNADESLVNFDDMIYWNAIGKDGSDKPRVNPLRFDLVVTDEVQDTNAARLAMLMNIIGDTGRSIAVGDRRQSIYGWSGADEEAMDHFRERTNAFEMPLDITYRCPESIVAMAQEIVPQIKARPGAPEGIIRHINEFELLRNLKDGALVLCRTNAPLVKPAFQMLAEGRKAIIVGRDIGAGLVSLVDRVAKKNNTQDAFAMLSYLQDYVEIQVKRYELQGKTSRAAMLVDQAETIEAISDGCRTVEEVRSKITKIFGDEKSEGVRFSSIHRAKGTETDDEYILRPDLMPWPKSVDNPKELRAEMNVKYVALTRSKNALTFVHGING